MISLFKFKCWYRYRSWGIPVILYIAIISTLFSGALGAGIDAHNNHTNNLTTILGLVVGCILMSLHGAYLWLMSRDFIYQHPVNEPIASAYLVYPCMAFGYFTHAWATVHDKFPESVPEPFFINSFSLNSLYVGPHQLYIYFFILAYITLAIHGIRELLRVQRDRMRKRMRSICFLVLDVIILITLIIAIIYTASQGHEAPESYESATPELSLKYIYHYLLKPQCSAKDLLIIDLLVTYVCVKAAVGYELTTERQRNKMLQRLKQSPKMESVNWKKIKKILPESCVWMDLGTGLGRDICELVEQIHLSNKPELYLIDKDVRKSQIASAYMDDLKRLCSKVESIKSDMNSLEVQRIQRSCNVVSLSHTCYYSSTAASALQFLSRCNSGTFVILRYSSPKSLYRVLSSALSNRLNRPYAFHRMYPILKGELETRGWKEIDNSNCILDQTYNISDENKREVLAEWIDCAYDETAGDIIEAYSKSLDEAKVTELDCSDRLVILQKS